jgi:hypothetical protein
MVFKLPTARRRDGADGGQAEGGLVKETGKMREIDGCQFLYIYYLYQLLVRFVPTRVKAFETLRDRRVRGRAYQSGFHGGLSPKPASP